MQQDRTIPARVIQHRYNIAWVREYCMTGLLKEGTERKDYKL